MRILVGDELLELNDDDLAWMYVAQGNEAQVYQYGNEALKIYKEGYCDKLRLSEEETIQLSRINTYRLLLPRRIIRDANNGNFIGYTTPFIKKATTTGIIRMRMPDFMEEVNLLKSDIMTLSNYYVEVEDFDVNNTAYDGRIYLVDPGSYRIRTTPNLMRFVGSTNFFNLNTYVKKELFGMVNLTRAERALVDVIFPDYDYIGDVIQETASENESVRQYVKRMTS